MLSRKGTAHAGIIVGIVAVVLFAVLLYATVSPDGDDGNKTAGEARHEILSASPGHLVVANSTSSWTETQNHTNIELNGVPDIESTELASTVVVEQGGYSGNKFVKLYASNNNSVGATLFFNVLDVDGGAVLVYINGKKVFSGELDIGAEVEVELAADELLPGEENTIEFRVSKPSWSWLLFWRENMYKLEGIYLDEQVFNEEKSTEDITFSLGDDQVIGLTSAEIVADVSLFGDAESKNVFVDFGEERIYENVPSAVGGVIDVDLPLHSFSPGENIITFSTELGGAYIMDAMLTLKFLNLTSANYKVYAKPILDEVWPYVEAAQAGEDYECELYLKKSAGSDVIVVWINGHRQELAFDVSDEIKQDVCGFLSKGTNTFRLIAEASDSSDDDFIDVERIRLTVKDK